MLRESSMNVPDPACTDRRRSRRSARSLRLVVVSHAIWRLCWERLRIRPVAHASERGWGRLRRITAPCDHTIVWDRRTRLAKGA